MQSRTRQAALDQIRMELVACRSADDRAEVVAVVLEFLRAPVLRDWAREVCGRPLRRDDAIDALISHYVGVLPEHDDADDGDSPHDGLSFEYDPTCAAIERWTFQNEVVGKLSVVPGRTGRRLLIHIAAGGGKTLTVNDWLWEHVLPRGKRVLWLTKDWELLRQAASDLCRRKAGARQRLGRIGGAHALTELVESPGASIVYTTVHTWSRRGRRMLRSGAFDYIVIDEVHWGEGQSMYTALQRRYRDDVTFIGLTATPRAWSDYEPICSYPYRALVDLGILAPAARHVVRTGVNWSPSLNPGNEFSPASLGELARSERRNRLVVSTYASQRELFGKTLVFACDVDHAERLARLFSDSGFSADVLHYGLTPDQRRAVLARFRTRAGEQRSRTDILVNVAMLTHGVDIPDIRTIFLARPTTSEILFVQMVGRGARRAPGKDRFHVVDFVDNLELHGELLQSVDRVYGSDCAPKLAEGTQPRRPSVRPRYHYVPARITTYPGPVGYEDLCGLEIQPMQDFGIEFEITRHGYKPGEKPDDWESIARELLAAMRTAREAARVAHSPAAEHGSATDHSVWNVEYDSSCGWEIKSPVLRGERGFEEVADVMRCLRAPMRKLHLCVNYRTGTHVHLAYPRLGVDGLRCLMQAIAAIEPALFSLVAPSRFNNVYCGTATNALARLNRLPDVRAWRRFFDEDDRRRCLTVNPEPMLDGIPGTLEIRMHSGTTEAAKILTWVSLWMRLVDGMQQRHWTPPAAASMRNLPLCRGAQGDITAVARSLGAGPSMLERLNARRTKVIQDSWFKHPEYGALARAVYAGWT